MEVGQPAAGAPATAIAAARAALLGGRARLYRNARHRRRCAGASRAPMREWHGLDIDPARIVVTTGSSAGFILAFLAAFEPGDRVAVALPGYPPYRHILTALGCEPVGIETTRADALVDHRRSAARAASRTAAQRRGGRLSRQSDRHDDDRGGARPTLIRCAEDAGIAVISDEIYHGLDYAFAAECAARISSDVDHHQFVLQIFLHDRMADRLDGGAAAAGAGRRAAAAESRDFGADALADRRRSRVRRARRAGDSAARLRGEPAHPARGIAARRPRFLPAGRRRVLSLCRRVAVLDRQFRVRDADAGGGGRGGDARRRFRSAARHEISCACAMPVRRTRCARRSSGSEIGCGKL